MSIVDICTIIGIIISLCAILYKIGRLSSKIDSNTHRLNDYGNRIEKLDDRIYNLRMEGDSNEKNSKRT
jgi:hypothetical protein